MRTVPRTPAAAILLLLAGPALGAQQNPDFSGAWRTETRVAGPALDPSRPGVTGRSGPGMTIVQDGKRLVLQGNELRSEYALDGSESTCQVRISGRRVPVACRARWEGARLVLHYKVPLPGGERDHTQTLSIDATGALVIETVVSGGAGGTLRLKSRLVRQRPIASRSAD